MSDSAEASVNSAIKSIDNSIDKIEDILKAGLECEHYDEFDLKDKVNYDLFVAYTLNTLYWIYLRTRGVDPNKHEIKNELSRIKEYMLKAKQAQEREQRPKVAQAAAKRFVKHGLGMGIRESEEPPAKKSKD